MFEDKYLIKWQQVITDKGIYTVVEQIGEGNFGRVFKAVDANSQKFFAIKQVPSFKLKDELIRVAFEREIEIQKKIENPNVVKLYEDYYHAPSQSYLLVMRYCQDGDLAEKIKKDGVLYERLAINYFKQILNGFLGLHQEGIIHRDIKPSNIYLDKGVAVIGDFGFARRVEQGEFAKSQLGTFSYMAPEMFQNQPYIHSVDIYSLGVLLYNMIFGEVPFKALSSNYVDLYDQIKKGNIDFTLKDINISKETQTLIKRMLAYEVKDRITWKEICQLPLLSGSLKYPEEKICLAILEGEKINFLSNKEFYEAHPQLEKLEVVKENKDQKYPSLQNLQKQPNPQDQEKQKLLQQQQQQQLQLQQQQQLQQKQQDLLLQKQQAQAKIDAQKKEDEIFSTGINKYFHLRNLYGNLIRILNDINTLKEFKINYQIPAFMTAKKIIQQIKQLLKIIKDKQNIFNIQPFDKFVATQQYANFSSNCEVNLKDMRGAYPLLLQECKDSITRLRLTHPPLIQQLATEETDDKFDAIYKECLTNYSFGLREQCNKDQTDGQRNLFCHLIHVSEMVQYESFEKDNFAFDFTQHKNEIRKIPFEQFEKKLDEAFQRIFS